MTALSAAKIRRHSTPIGQSHASRYLGLLTAVGIVYPGALIMQVQSALYVQPAGAGTVDVTVLVTLANDLKTQYVEHIANTGAVFHTAADATNTIAAADATNLATAITLLNELRTDYAAHRVKVSSSTHAATDNTNATTAAAASDQYTAVLLALDLRARFNGHRTESGIHAIDDTLNPVTAADASVPQAVCLGWADIPFAIDTTSLASGDRKIHVRDGIVGPLDNSAGADEVTAAHRNKIVYLANDNTVSATTQGGSLSCPVRLDRIDSEGCYVLIGREQV